ncbi:LytR/AlgR family response regulator transcription factor [Hufsiella ginkgonis]|uniref:Response regulator n=1 Tax=Hufsiella ginkgonis TaxID=2695274 RepID=A0A7K1XU15_9SPHI|nr:LytTR family DNA-binding domain-containing protein [Hufsiella ginkgonis]MXV14495.1 response regulator [Hufsiella ginkgonis]
MDIRCVLIDDEPNNLENLEGMITRWCPGIAIVGAATNAGEGLRVIEKENPDLVFLDIQMPGQSGFDLLKALNEVTFEVIFVTAFDHYGIQAIKFSALDYLLKPIDVTELRQAIEKARLKLAAKQQNLSIQNLLSFIRRSQKDLPKIALPTMQETRYVKVNEIVRCEALDNYTRFFMHNGDKVLVCKTLKEFAELLRPYDFYRTHQSHLVNFHYVKSLLKEDGGMLLLDDGSKIPISRQNLEAIKKALNNMT